MTVLTNLTIMRLKHRPLKAMKNRADTVGMSATASHSVTFEQNCLIVLECYAVRDAAAKVTQTEYAGWLDRILDIPGLEPSSLTSIHGFLIAQGLIKFEFTGRSVGLQYQLSPLGRESISNRTLFLPDESRNGEGSAESLVDGKAHAA